MQPEDLKILIEKGIPGAEVQVSGEGCNAAVVVVAEAFAGKSLLAQQRMVYACVDDLIKSGELHALSIKSYTPEQWAAGPGAA